MLNIPPYSQIHLMKAVEDFNRTSRYEREIEDRQREAEFARQAVIVIEEKPARGLRALALNLRAFLF